MEYVPHGIGFPAEEARKLERELAAVTEQRDELARQNKLFRNETLICADCDAVRKDEYDTVIQQRDEVREVLRSALEERDKKWFQIIESFAGYHPVSMTDALQQGIAHTKKLKSQRDEARIELEKYTTDSEDDALYNVRRLRKELTSVTEQRDEARCLAERYRNLSCDSLEEADETLLPWEITTPKEP
jgi:hypothetical protein